MRKHTEVDLVRQMPSMEVCRRCFQSRGENRFLFSFFPYYDHCEIDFYLRKKDGRIIRCAEILDLSKSIAEESWLKDGVMSNGLVHVKFDDFSKWLKDHADNCECFIRSEYCPYLMEQIIFNENKNAVFLEKTPN